MKYRFSWQTRHDIHSPFIFDFIETVLRDKDHYKAYSDLRDLRQKLSKEDLSISLTDLGAGSRKPSKEKTVADILKTSVQAERYQKLLFRIMVKYAPQTVVELGTSLGLTTSWIYEGLIPNGELYTLEGDPMILDFAKRKVFTELNALSAKLECIEGNFDATLPDLLNKLEAVDLAYIDGNHTYEATMRYFKMFLPKMSSRGILIFDDIYWSEGMKQAWKEISEHPASQYTVDLFQLGIVFMDPVKVKQHFVLKY